MNNDWRHGYSEYDDGTRRARHTDAPGRYEASDAGDQAYAQTPYSRYSGRYEPYAPQTYQSSYAPQETSRSYYGVQRGYGGTGHYRDENNDDLSRPSYRDGYGYTGRNASSSGETPRRSGYSDMYTSSENRRRSHDASPRAYGMQNGRAYTPPRGQNTSPRQPYAPSQSEDTHTASSYASARGGNAYTASYAQSGNANRVQADAEYTPPRIQASSTRRKYAPPRYTDTHATASAAKYAPPADGQSLSERMAQTRHLRTDETSYDPAYSQPSFSNMAATNMAPSHGRRAAAHAESSRLQHAQMQAPQQSEPYTRQAQHVSSDSGSMRGAFASHPAEATSPLRRQASPVDAERTAQQDAAQVQQRRDDVQERLTRMRMAGEAALRAQGYEEEDAKAFMDTGMINLDAALGNLNEDGVDPALSAQQTARMAVIRQAQMDAPLQQPSRVKGTHSRPGYEAQPDGKGTKGGKRRWRGAVEWAVTLAAAVIVALLLRTFVVSFYRVLGPSMQPTFYTDERLLVDKISYHFGEIRRFDVVVCHYPGSDDYYVKRVIALPGDTIWIDEGVVYVNGEELEEPYVVNRDDTSMPETVVPADSYMVFGDNRADSMDSRSIGAISRDAIVGRAVAVTWPISRIQGIERIEDTAPAAGSAADNADASQDRQEDSSQTQEETPADDEDSAAQDDQTKEDLQTQTQEQIIPDM